MLSISNYVKLESTMAQTNATLQTKNKKKKKKKVAAFQTNSFFIRFSLLQVVSL
jgi:hypothetical protein